MVSQVYNDVSAGFILHSLMVLGMLLIPEGSLHLKVVELMKEGFCRYREIGTVTVNLGFIQTYQPIYCRYLDLTLDFLSVFSE